MDSKNRNYKFLVWGLVVALLAIVMFSFYMGRFTTIAPSKIVGILLNGVIPIKNPHWSLIEQGVILNLRFPRIITAMVVGPSLAVAGCAFQVVFSNPVAAPDTLGITSSASCGAVVAILLGLSSFMVKVSSFASACIAIMFVLVFAIKLSKGKSLTVYLILIGMVVSSFFSAIMTIVKYIADPTTQLPQITYWLMGSFANIRMEDLTYCLLFFAIGMVPLYLLRWRLNLLSLKDSEAKAMGVNVTALRITTILGATLLTASSVAMTGGISWVGLVIPHITRLLVGNDTRKLLPVSSLLGASFLLLMDTLARSLTPSEIPISILTSLFGAPIFFMMLIKNRGGIGNED